MTSDAIESKLRGLGFTSTGTKLGEGAWGVVDEYKDAVGQRWAIKKYRTTEVSGPQVEHRRLSLENMIEKESIPLSASQHGIVPRIVGEGFVAMPVYGPFDKCLEDGKPLEIGRALKVSQQVARSLAYFESGLKKVYCDLKPSNLLVDENGNVLLTDFSAATFLSPSMQSKDPRDNIGEICTRAYECFKKESHPDARSDIFALGAFIGRLLTGHYLNERRLRNSVDPVKEMQEIHPLEANARLIEYVDKVPVAFRKFLRKCLSYDPDSRYKNSVDAEKAFERAVVKYESSRPMPRLKRLGVGLAAVALLGTALFGLNVANKSRLKLEERTKQVAIEKETRHHIEIVERYLVGGSSRMDSGEYISLKRLYSWMRRFCGENYFSSKERDSEKFYTAVAAYIESVYDEETKDFLPPIKVYTAIQMAGGKTGYKDIKPYLEELDKDYKLTPWIGSIRNKYVDGFVHAGNYEEEGNKRAWEKARQLYEQRAAQKAEEERKTKQLERAMMGGVDRRTNSPMLGGLPDGFSDALNADEMRVEPYKGWKYIKK